METVLVSTEERCRMCMKVLGVNPSTHVVVIYDEQFIWFTVGSRVTKCCRTCNRKNASPSNVLEIYLHCLTTSLEER